MRTVIRIAVSCLLIVAACSVASAREIDKDFHETFDVSEGVVLRLDYGDGDATITPWDQDVIDVVVHYRADVKTIGFGKEPDFDVEFKQTDDRVTVSGIEGGFAGVYFFSSMREYEYTYTIKAPSYVRLDLTGDDGDLELSGWRADIECRVDDGDVKFTDVVNGNTEIRIEDGDVRLAKLSGDLVVRGDDGDISVTNSTLSHALFALEDGDVRISDSEGDFDIALDDGDVTLSRVTTSIVDVRGEDGSVDLDIASAADIHINVVTDDGDVTIRLAGGLSFQYLVTMDDGRVDVDIDGSVETDHREHRISGKVGTGGGLVRVSTADGNVELTTAD
jgi:type 1 fimbria pilin